MEPFIGPVCPTLTPLQIINQTVWRSKSEGCASVSLGSSDDGGTSREAYVQLTTSHIVASIEAAHAGMAARRGPEDIRELRPANAADTPAGVDGQSFLFTRRGVVVRTSKHL